MKTVLKWVNKKNSNFPDFSKASHFQSKKKKKKKKFFAIKSFVWIDS
jgi:hypothetical protein